MQLAKPDPISLRARFALRLLIAGALVLLPACATPGVQSASASAEPRPIGVLENASPDDKGREILRVVIELVKHGDLLDTEFASRLLRLPITPDKGFQGPNPPPFPQQLAKSFGYAIRDVGPIRQSVVFHLDPEEVCVRFDEFLAAFNKEFGIGTGIFRDNRSPPPRIVPLEQGWKELNRIHFTGTRGIYQAMPNGLVVHGELIGVDEADYVIGNVLPRP